MSVALPLLVLPPGLVMRTEYAAASVRVTLDHGFCSAARLARIVIHAFLAAATHFGFLGVLCPLGSWALLCRLSLFRLALLRHLLR